VLSPRAALEELAVGMVGIHFVVSAGAAGSVSVLRAFWEV